jgi:hypothetical protein
MKFNNKLMRHHEFLIGKKTIHHNLEFNSIPLHEVDRISVYFIVSMEPIKF